MAGSAIFYLVLHLYFCRAHAGQNPETELSPHSFICGPSLCRRDRSDPILRRFSALGLCHHIHSDRFFEYIRTTACTDHLTGLFKRGSSMFFLFQTRPTRERLLAA
jgi:hypothetical protein